MEVKAGKSVGTKTGLAIPRGFRVSKKSPFGALLDVFSFFFCIDPIFATMDRLALNTSPSFTGTSG